MENLLLHKQNALAGWLAAWLAGWPLSECFGSRAGDHFGLYNNIHYFYKPWDNPGFVTKYKTLV